MRKTEAERMLFKLRAAMAKDREIVEALGVKALNETGSREAAARWLKAEVEKDPSLQEVFLRHAGDLGLESVLRERPDLLTKH